MDIKIEREFNAPIEKVWKYWTDPKELVKWWGPKYWTAPSAESDFQVGGKYLYAMRGAMALGGAEQTMWSGGVFKEIIPMKKIVSSDYFTDEKGNKVNAKEVGMPGEWPDEMTITATFEDLGGKTKLTIFHEGHPSEMAENAKSGWNSSLDKLAAVLEEEAN
ncbi:MAG TPA: SRPBCC domain-containing protein [Candidatus Paceibacterota bacterium]|jgi:uncharacterized protein YndB with AHSA1/START domain|nr:SRPBCC domain-containing protein [Candidatus Paceibacterota bacterium]